MARPITEVERDAVAKSLEIVASRLRSPEGHLEHAITHTSRPIEVSDDEAKFRYTGSYHFHCDIEIQFNPGEWTEYSNQQPKKEWVEIPE